MELNAPTFLFLFLPVFLVLYFACGKRLRGVLLLVSSLVFFIWGDPLYFPVSFGLALLTGLFLRSIQTNTAHPGRQKRLRAWGVLLIITVLLLFKILAAYGPALAAWAASKELALPGWLRMLLPHLAHLPLGLSFLAFQAISLLLDAPYELAGNEKPLLPVSLHLLLFPKAISGPLQRFEGFLPQFRQRDLSIDQIAAGLRRFMFGFAKKALVADQLALITDRGIFSQSPRLIPTNVAWLVIFSYTLQIYIDFSAYCDMAIGLGQALGFHFPENFNHPYISVSITDFWRRWHMTLSAWFRDYVFYPLEKKRASLPWFSQSMNILIVFLLTGLWHGITPPFIIWGLLQGIALALERDAFGRWLRRLWRPLQHLYALLVILLGWVFFRSPSLTYAFGFLKALLNFSHSAQPLPWSTFPPVSTLTWLALAAGMLLSLPLRSALAEKVDFESTGWQWARGVLALALFLAGMLVQAGAAYQPFIYGDF